MIPYDFPKLIELDEFTKHSEPTIQIVRPRDTSVPHVKVANEAMDYIKHVQPEPGKTIILVLAMTAGEYYGANRNGDGWPEKPLTIGRTRITPEDVLPAHYKTFETDATVYRHHINKDPAKSIGDVMKAFYNWPMHRVELLLSLDNDKARDVVQEIEKGKFPAVSMGCKIKYDVCSICGNPAPSRAQYCDHARFQLGDFLPNGKQVLVWNPSPRFFDMSLVRRPADRIGYMMKKVATDVYEIRGSAELGEKVAFLSGKLSDARKLSVIDKIMHGDAVATKEDDGDLNVVKDYANNIAKPAAAAMPPLDDGLIRDMVQYRPAEVLSTLASMGIFLTTPEFIKFFVWKADPNITIPDDALQRAAEAQQLVFKALSQNPELVEEILSTDFLDITPDNVDPTLLSKFAPLLEKRSQMTQFTRQRLIDAVLHKVASEPGRGEGNWDTLDIVDPVTGARYRTTRGAIMAAHESLPKAKMHALVHNLLGGGALMSGAYKLFGANEPMEHQMRLYRRAAALDTIPYLSTTGVEVPVGTELSKVSMDVKGATMRLAHDCATVPASSSTYRKVANMAPPGPGFAGTNFDTMANWLGKVICP